MGARSQQVFLVDDDDDLRFATGMSLRDAGFDVRDFSSADDALAALLANPPGAIFLDYRIAGMSADDFLVAVRGAGHDDVPVILLTGSHNIGELAQQLDVFDALPKPFEIDELVEHARKANAANR